MGYKALAIDLDGTLVLPGRILDLRGAEAIRKVRIPIILATGNNPCFTHAAAKLIGTGDIMIAENGGVIRVGKEEYIEGNKKECEKAWDILKDKIYLERLDDEYRKTDIVIRKTCDPEEIRKVLRNYDLDVDVVDTGFAIHIKKKGVNKGKALKKVSEMIGIDIKDFVGIGDAENDKEMLEIVGFGIAVGNAREEIKEIADYVTKGEYGEGVAEAVDMLLSRLG
ncbi:MAG: phosphoglycolate phosphatase [Candidatus Syntropharchaeia archaeon]